MLSFTINLDIFRQFYHHFPVFPMEKILPCFGSHPIRLPELFDNSLSDLSEFFYSIEPNDLRFIAKLVSFIKK